MPHVVVKLWPGKSDAQKRELSDAIVADLTRILGSTEESISVAFEEVEPSQWFERVYEPDIQGAWDALTKTPGYGPGPTSAE